MSQCCQGDNGWDAIASHSGQGFSSNLDRELDLFLPSFRVASSSPAPRSSWTSIELLTRPGFTSARGFCMSIITCVESQMISPGPSSQILRYLVVLTQPWMFFWAFSLQFLCSAVIIFAKKNLSYNCGFFFITSATIYNLTKTTLFMGPVILPICPPITPSQGARRGGEARKTRESFQSTCALVWRIL